MLIRIITVGSKSAGAMASLIAEYEKRLPPAVRIEWLFLRHGSAADVATSKQQESENILKAIAKASYVLLFDETGTQISNKTLAKKLFSVDKTVTCIIGGAHGVNEAIKRRADCVISLSSLVLPHQIVRLILIEQIYRSHAIHTNHPYHHS